MGPSWVAPDGLITEEVQMNPDERLGGYGDVLGQLASDVWDRTPKEKAAFNKARVRSADVAIECFDYIMNTEGTYRELGQAIGFFERAMKRDRKTVKQEMCDPHGRGGSHPWSKIGLRRWYLMMSELIGKARKDYKKHFNEEFTDGGPTWITDVDHRLVLLFALKYRDRWAT
jgi:hypothetical protein